MIPASQLNPQGSTDEPRHYAFTEAPASWNVKYLMDGFDCMLTVRGESGRDLMPVTQAVIKWLQENGAEPTRPVYRDAQPGPSETKANSQPQEQRIPLMADGSPDPAWCSLHNVAMARRERDGQVWYSHKVGDSYCKGK